VQRTSDPLTLCTRTGDLRPYNSCDETDNCENRLVPGSHASVDRLFGLTLFDWASITTASSGSWSSAASPSNYRLPGRGRPDGKDRR
jgi:hypothetical protein